MNLEDILRNNFKNNDIRMYFNRNNLMLEKEKLETIIDKNNYETIVDLMLLNEEYKCLDNVFKNVFTQKNELDNFDEKSLNNIKQLDIDKFPLVVSSRIYDVLWSKFHDVTCGSNAVKKYLELFEVVYNPDEWICCLNLLYRATVISAQIGKNNQLYSDCIDKVIEKLNLMDGKDGKFLSIELLELLDVQKYNDRVTMLNLVDKIIKNAQNDSDIYKVEKAYSLKLKIEKDQNKKKIINSEMAVYYENYADSIVENDFRNVVNKVSYFQKAIHNYNEAGEKEKAKETMKKLGDTQKNIDKHMATIKSKPFDYTKIIKEIKKMMEGLSFEEAIILLALNTKFHKKEDIKNKVLQECKTSIGMCLFPEKILDKEGKTLIELPGLDWNEPEKDEKTFELYMLREILKSQEIEGFILSIMLNEIIDKYKFTKEDIKFLVKDNVIIPEGREDIILNGIYFGLVGDYYTSLHILAPQMENLFRTIARDVGGVTFTLENDNTSKVKVLSSVFEIDELKECYDENILFVFRALLNEQASGNIRNDIGHGIMDEDQANSNLGKYFLSAVIKLCYLTSKEARVILENSENLTKIIKKGHS